MRRLFTKQDYVEALEMFRDGAKPRTVQQHLQRKNGKRYTDHQVRCLRSRLGVGPRQLNRKAIPKQLPMRQPPQVQVQTQPQSRNGYRVTIVGEGVSLDKPVSISMAIALLEMATSDHA